MKSIADYVALEPQYYQHVLDNYQELFQKTAELQKRKALHSIVLFATGSSSNAAFGARPFMSQILQMPVFVEEPSMAANYLINKDPHTLYVAISQGGHSYSIINLVKQFEEQQQIIYALTSDTTSPLYQISEHVLSMGMPVEQMPYVSAGYSVTILDLMLLALAIAQNLQLITASQIKAYQDQIQTIITALPQVISHSQDWVEQQAAAFQQAQRVIFIGYGATYGTAREGETKLTETAHLSAWGKELEEYMHGPYIGLHEPDYIVFIEPQGKLEPRARALKQFLQDHVQHLYTIFANKDEADISTNLNLHVDSDELLASLFMTIPIHLLSYQVSQLQGHDLESSTYPEFDEITKSKI
ncbi:SIS domain-containing protein [Lactobacillus sp. XV13L]|nr:SIS domain-containing protein [Lactobacillus sp. XV13L]